MQKWLPVALLAILFFILYGKIATHVGFLSDDWDLMAKASHASLLLPLEKNHYSLLLNILFKAAAHGTISPFFIHLLAFVFHFANCLLIYLIAHSALKIEFFRAWILAFLFAINPAGLEALAWCCAIGYVACAFWILLGLYFFLQYLNQQWEIKNTFLFALTLIVIQSIAFLCWDWGVTMTPALILAGIFHSKDDQKKVSRLKILVPLVLSWSSLIVLKKMFSFKFGYVLNTPTEIAKSILESPFMGLFPQFKASFYTSIPGISLALITFLLLLLSCRHRKTLFLFLLFFILLSPQILMGEPQSRYFYLPMFALYFVALSLLDKLAGQSSFPTIASLTWVLLLFTHLFWTNQRVTLWKEAYAQARSIEEELRAIAKKEKSGLLVVNLPDRYGPEGMVWLPFVWRAGYHQFPYPLECVNTPDCHNLYPQNGWAIIPREEITAKYPSLPAYEVFFKSLDNYRDYEIKPLKSY